jgi:O-antigen/teichoic acid export membrane protein
MRPVSKIFVDMTKSAGASGIQFLITLVTTPLMTRLYEPAAYATFGILNSMASLAIGIGMLSLPHAYLIEKDPAARARVMQVMLLLVGALLLLSIVAAVTIATSDLLHAGTVATIFLPILVLTYGVRQILVIVAIERANFSSTALGQIVEPICSRGGSIALGAIFGGHPAFILACVALGYLVTSATILRMLFKNTWRAWRVLFNPGVKPLAIMRHYADFATFSTASQQAQPLVMLGIQLAIVAFASPDLAGHYMLATSMLTLPITVIALTTAPVLYRHFIAMEHDAPAQLVPHLMRAMALYLLAGTIILSPVFFFGTTIFTVAFGVNWGPAGHMASILSVAYVSMFAMTGVQSIFFVTKRLRTQFTLEIVTCAVALVAAIAMFKLMDFQTALVYLAAIWFLRNMVLLVACMLVARAHTKQTIRVT